MWDWLVQPLDSTGNVHCFNGNCNMWVQTILLNFSHTDQNVRILGGDRFDIRTDQEALLDVLVRTENDHARRTTAVQSQMKEAWGWSSED